MAQEQPTSGLLLEVEKLVGAVDRVRSGARLFDVTVRHRPPGRRAATCCAGPVAPAAYVTEAIRRNSP